MRAVIQRTSHSRVLVNEIEVAQIKHGLTVLLGVKRNDSETDCQYMMDKIVNLRIFADEFGKMNRSLLDINGGLLLVSQFTLYGDARKGRRPSFTDAELPDKAESLINYCLHYLRDKDITIATGVFGADMQVEIVNDGPCTMLLDSEKLF